MNIKSKLATSIKSKLALFVVCLVVLFAFQSKVIIPFLFDVASSDLFLKESDDIASEMPISNTMTEAAFAQCNAYIKSRTDTDAQVSFTAHPVNAWSLGDYQYVINADIQIATANATGATHRYACRIKYLKDNDPSGASNPENWSIEGLSGIPDA
jgi:hypothetical protein